jgi:hypothetical protein
MVRLAPVKWIAQTNVINVMMYTNVINVNGR